MHCYAFGSNVCSGIKLQLPIQFAAFENLIRGHLKAKKGIMAASRLTWLRTIFRRSVYFAYGKTLSTLWQVSILNVSRKWYRSCLLYILVPSWADKNNACPALALASGLRLLTSEFLPPVTHLIHKPAKEVVPCC